MDQYTDTYLGYAAVIVLSGVILTSITVSVVIVEYLPCVSVTVSLTLTHTLTTV